MIKYWAAIVFSTLVSGQAFAQQAEEVTPLALRAMERGYGGTCSLEMIPVARGGYYPCLDFGPYRIVKQYGRVTGYVVREGRAPYLVFKTEAGEGGFVVRGPWETDMPAKIALFWNDVVEGKGAEAKAKQEIENERQAAEAFIAEQAPKPAAAPSSAPAAVPSSEQQPPVRQDSKSGTGGGILDAISGTTPRR